MRVLLQAIILAVALVLLAGCATTPGNQRSGWLPRIGISHPDSLPGFELIERLPNENPLIGNKLRFQSISHPELASDLFVYVGDVYPSLDTAAKGMVDDTYQSLVDAQRSGLMSKLELLSERRYPVDTRYGSNDGAHARFAFQREEGELISHAHLFYLPPYTFKFRSSFPSYGNTSFDDQIDEWVRGFMSQVSIDIRILCRNVHHVHKVRDLDDGWISLDGHDIVVPMSYTERQITQLEIQALKRRQSADCTSP